MILKPRPLAFAIILAMATSSGLWAFDVQKDIVDKSREYIGCQYRTGGVKPREFDCSGFVGYVMRPFVPGLPRLSRDMADFGRPVAKDQLRTGDLVFFATTGTPGAISHVALYIGNGEIIHAISDGPERGVRVTPLDARYWKAHYHSSARVLTDSATAPAKPATSPAKVDAPGKPTPAKTDSPAPEPTPAKTDAAPEKRAQPAQPARKASPWDTWDGIVKGDYEQWKAEQKRAFEESKKKYDKDREGEEFRKWKSEHGE